MMKAAAAAMALLLVAPASVQAMDTSSQPGEDITVVTNTPAVHRVSDATFVKMDSSTPTCCCCGGGGGGCGGGGGGGGCFSLAPACCLALRGWACLRLARCSRAVDGAGVVLLRPPARMCCPFGS
jgi:hypothetical protein